MRQDVTSVEKKIAKDKIIENSETIVITQVNIVVQHIVYAI